MNFDSTMTLVTAIIGVMAGLAQVITNGKTLVTIAKEDTKVEEAKTEETGSQEKTV